MVRAFALDAEYKALPFGFRGDGRPRPQTLILQDGSERFPACVVGKLAARAAGYSWAAVAAMLGVSKQTAQVRYGA